MIAGQQLVKALDNSEGIILITDADGTIEFVNKSFERIYGYAKEEVIGKKPSIIRSGFHSKAFYDELWNTIKNGNNWNGDFVNRTKDGTIVSEEASVSPVFADKSDEIIGYIAVKYNISERKKLKEQLELREQLFERLFENSPVGIFVLEALKSGDEIYDFNISRANLKSSVIFNRISFINQHLSTVLKTKNIGGLLKKYKTIQQGEEVYEWEDFYSDKVLEFKMFNLSPNQKCLLITDISSKVEMESKLKDSEKHLRELNETKDKIFSIIAHDLKNPFQAIIGFASMLNEGVDKYSTLELKKMAGKISDVSEQTYKLLEDLLTWSKSQLGQLSPKPTKLNAHDMVEKIFEQMKVLADKKNINLVNDINQSDLIKGDSNMLEFAIRNLVHNGIKFSTPGGKVHCYTSSIEDKLALHVEDSGIGIQPSKLKEIFTLKGNLSTTGTSEEAGTGLGLMLSNQMVELNNGEIKVSSEPGKGTCFTVVLEKA